jgi:predicted nucleic-acid-binding protein
MIGLDTNVLLRHLVHDDPVQSQKAKDLIERRLSSTSPGFISVVAFAETAWVLQRHYKITGPQLVDSLKQLLGAEDVIVEHEREVFSALRVLQSGRGTFADGLIAALGFSAGCEHTYTFDEKATRMPQFKRQI